MKCLLLVFAVLYVAVVTGEYCGHDSDCLLERCPHGYVTKCETPANVCSCEHAGECQSSNDCQSKHGRCENNDKHWYCNGNKCCCGEPCSHAGDNFICSSSDDCANQFWRCTNNDKHWYCTDRHCHCGSRHGSIQS